MFYENGNAALRIEPIHGLMQPSALRSQCAPVLPRIRVKIRAYDAVNRPIARRLGNGLVELRRYDLQGRRLDQSLGAVDARAYRYDANGNILERPATPQNKAWAYDSLDRLVTDTTNSQAVQLGYDANGNRLSRAANDSTFNEVYAYAQAGSRLAVTDKTDTTAIHTPASPPPTERTLSYNNAGRLFQVFDNGTLAATYVYNGDGLRTRKVTSAGTILYHYNPQGRLISETRQDGTPIRDYIWQDNEPLTQIDISATTESLIYLHTDHLLTPRLATDPSGTVVWHWEGEAFGRTLANEDPDGDGRSVVVNLRFPGQYYDQGTGLHYNYFRYYDPSIGRYITSDPIGQKGGINTYDYVIGNPLRFVDPLGLICFSFDQDGFATCSEVVEKIFPDGSVPGDEDRCIGGDPSACARGNDFPRGVGNTICGMLNANISLGECEPEPEPKDKCP